MALNAGNTVYQHKTQGDLPPSTTPVKANKSLDAELQKRGKRQGTKKLQNKPTKGWGQ